MRTIVILLVFLCDVFANRGAHAVFDHDSQRNLSQSEIASLAPGRVVGNRAHQAVNAKSEDDAERGLNDLDEKLMPLLGSSVSTMMREQVFEKTEGDLASIKQLPKLSAARHVKQIGKQLVNKIDGWWSKRSFTDSIGTEPSLQPTQGQSAIEKERMSGLTPPNRRSPPQERVDRNKVLQRRHHASVLQRFKFGELVKKGVTPFSWKAMIDAQSTQKSTDLVIGLPLHTLIDTRSTKMHTDLVKNIIDRWKHLIDERKDNNPTTTVDGLEPFTWESVIPAQSTKGSTVMPQNQIADRKAELERLKPFTDEYLRLVKDHRTDPLSLVLTFREKIGPMTIEQLALFKLSKDSAKAARIKYKDLSLLADVISPYDYAHTIVEFWQVKQAAAPENHRNRGTIMSQLSNPNQHIGFFTSATEKVIKEFTDFSDVYAKKLEDLQQKLNKIVDELP